MINLEGPSVNEGLLRTWGQCLFGVGDEGEAWGPTERRAGRPRAGTVGSEACGEACSGEKGTHFCKTSFMSSPCDTLSHTAAKVVVLSPPHVYGVPGSWAGYLDAQLGQGGAPPRSSNKLPAGQSSFQQLFPIDAARKCRGSQSHHCSWRVRPGQRVVVLALSGLPLGSGVSCRVRHAVLVLAGLFTCLGLQWNNWTFSSWAVILQARPAPRRCQGTRGPGTGPPCLPLPAFGPSRSQSPWAGQ